MMRGVKRQERKMDGNKKLIVALLVLAVVFSVISVIISISVSNLDVPGFRRPAATGQASGAFSDGGVGFEVEASSGGGG